MDGFKSHLQDCEQYVSVVDQIWEESMGITPKTLAQMIAKTVLKKFTKMINTGVGAVLRRGQIMNLFQDT